MNTNGENYSCSLIQVKMHFDEIRTKITMTNRNERTNMQMVGLSDARTDRKKRALNSASIELGVMLKMDLLKMRNGKAKSVCVIKEC